MAKGNRFPSPANVKKNNSQVSPPAPAPEAVKGVKQDLVLVDYKKDNHHILPHHLNVHALRIGINSVPRDVWEESVKHPSIQSMMDSGDIKVLETGKYEPVADESEEESEEKSESKDSEDSES